MMKHVFLRTTMFLGLFSANISQATTCVKPSDWIDAVCKYQPLEPNERCWTDPVSAGNMEAQCSAAVVDCSRTPDGGCFGSVNPGHWIVTGTATDGVKRCRCGCFAEETLFDTPNGKISASSLIGKADNTQQILANDGMDSWGVNFQSINAIVAGPETEKVYHFKTASGRSITVTKAHPVLVVDAAGHLQEMKQAANVEVNDRLLGDDSLVDPIVSITQENYGGRAINFNVNAQGGDKHIVFANNLRMGDNAWQQYLAASERRILMRNDLIKLLNKQ